MTEITDEKKREAMDALGRALDVAMYQTLAASIPACGAFGAIAQDLDFAFPILTAALSPAPQAPAGEAREDGIDTLLADRLGPWAASAGDDQREAAAADLDALLAAGWLPPSHAREQAERIERLEAALRPFADGREVADPNCPGATIVVSVDNPDEIARAALTPPASQEGQADAD